MSSAAAARDIDAENANFWRANGMCPRCGARVNKVIISGVEKIFEPLSVPGKVDRGRCLLCFPIRDGGQPVNEAAVSIPTRVPTADDDNPVQPENVPSQTEVSPIRPARATQTPPNPVAPTTDLLARDVATAGRSPSAPSGMGSRGHGRAASVPKPNSTLLDSDDASSDEDNQDLDRANAKKKPAAQKKNKNFLASSKGCESQQASTCSVGKKRPTSKKGNEAESKKICKEGFNIVIRDLDRSRWYGYLTEGTVQEGKGHFELMHKNDHKDYNGKVAIYDGDIRNGTMEGKGKMVNVNGAIYEGEFKKGGYNGYGTCQWPGQGRYKYTGHWVNNQRSGRGLWQQTAPEEDQEQIESYDGEWKSDLMHGEGLLNFAEGGYYQGEFRHDDEQGRGKYVFSDGSVYVGEFKSRYRHGKGKMTFAGGEKYEGSWSHNQRHGMGIMEYKDGSKFKGRMKNDKINDGTMYAADGSEKERYKNGKLQIVEV